MAINPDDWSSASRCISFQMIGDQRRATGLSRPTVYRILGEDCQASSQSRSAYPGANRQRIANSGGSFFRHLITPLNVSRRRHVPRRLLSAPACTARRESIPGACHRGAVIGRRRTDFSADL
jgi:hypothetical protein